jgi:hypothetical protein
MIAGSGYIGRIEDRLQPPICMRHMHASARRDKDFP